ncbi:hypothetical protein [Paenibacillus sp. Leaf72]|uniref:hypothetical protein n=1 Tax=Paenibacillus sp. Leaf72 TaxID=1736234 RepID=UPI000AB8845B|nr:hypothetical protein [Paenibacillus sp. Leaf72]
MMKKQYLTHIEETHSLSLSEQYVLDWSLNKTITREFASDSQQKTYNLGGVSFFTNIVPKLITENNALCQK